ncbi:response regulator transcription factor [Microbacteriaceae bacterium VKM Ac-2854]|nr:response regulator transcription factor [Microbacteriaceae bacterium VKM Ac-2854]
MVQLQGFSLAVIDGLAIERAALCALLGSALPGVSVYAAAVPPVAAPDAERSLLESVPPLAIVAEHPSKRVSIAIVDLDSIPVSELAPRLAEVAAEYAALVVLSTTVPLDAVRAILRAGLGAFVWKGDEPAELVAAIVSVASGRTWISEAARGRFLAASDYRRPVLSPQESRVMRSYGAGSAVKVVADEMRIAEHTVRTYIKRIKAKYLEVGVPLESRVDFYRHLHDHDVALRVGRGGMRAVPQQEPEEFGEPVAV